MHSCVGLHSQGKGRYLELPQWNLSWDAYMPVAAALGQMPIADAALHKAVVNEASGLCVIRYTALLPLFLLLLGGPYH